MADDAVGEHLGAELEGEYVEEDPVEQGEQILLGSAGRVERRQTRHRAAVGQDCQQDERVEERVLADDDRERARPMVRPQAAERAPRERFVGFAGVAKK